MKIIFGLGWAEARSKNATKIFKEFSAGELFAKYAERIGHDYAFEAVPMPFDTLLKQSGAIWICEREKKSRMLASEYLAQRFQKVCDSGVKTLTIWVGGPNGLSSSQMNQIQSHLLWSFGPMTLPHELASVVAAEQVYRAISILKNHPYHFGH
ncbi:MAG TPA: 23S rRNA (pseudouridine(1915)-N(3))-methyltransferase RlmH [Candidatus Omnitrophota bacterium]|nr:23S rRNA (pseudouridine(1915)-N(3))-methyltransferase RlmH [Candidatus Omnitrophota bacterium]